MMLWLNVNKQLNSLSAFIPYKAITLRYAEAREKSFSFRGDMNMRVNIELSKNKYYPELIGGDFITEAEIKNAVSQGCEKFDELVAISEYELSRKNDKED